VSRVAGDTRILVIGSAEHSRNVTCVNWSEVRPDLDPADFDAVIVNLTSLPRDSWGLLAAGPFRSTRFAKLVDSGGVLIVVLPKDLADQDVSSMAWLPFWMTVRGQSGETIHIFDPALENYMNLVSRWTFCFQPPCTVQHQVAGRQAGTEGYYDVVAQNRAGEPLAVVLADWCLQGNRPLRFADSDAGNELIPFHPDPFEIEGGPEECHAEQVTWGAVYLLPAPTDGNAKDGVDVLLQDLFGIAPETEEPEWAQRVVAPGQASLDEQISRCDAVIEEQTRKRKELIDARTEAREAVKLLYETGEALEKIVRATLREIAEATGGTVEEPLTPEGDDGRMRTRHGWAVLEVKGRKGSIPDDDVSQVCKWMDEPDMVAQAPKGILVANPYRKIAIGKRGKPFEPNVVQLASRRKVCLLTTQQLYLAYAHFKQDSSSAEDILSALYSSDGKIHKEFQHLFEGRIESITNEEV